MFAQYAGVWYEAYRHDINEVDTKCENGTYIVGLNGTINVTSQGFNQRTSYYIHQGVGKPRSTSEPASFLIHYEHPGIDEFSCAQWFNKFSSVSIYRQIWNHSNRLWTIFIDLFVWLRTDHWYSFWTYLVFIVGVFFLNTFEQLNTSIFLSEETKLCHNRLLKN